MSYLDPSNTQDFINYIIDLDDGRFDETTELYCKVVEIRKESFIYLPAVALIINEPALLLVLNRLDELSLTATIEKEDISDVYEDSDNTTYNCIIKHITQKN